MYEQVAEMYTKARESSIVVRFVLPSTPVLWQEINDQGGEGKKQVRTWWQLRSGALAEDTREEYAHSFKDAQEDPAGYCGAKS